MANELDPKKQFAHNNVDFDKVGVSQHPRAQGAPSASINDAEYKNAADERGEGVDDDNPATMPGFPVPVLRKTEHAKHLHDTRAEEVATTEQAHRATDIAGDTGKESDTKALEPSDNFGGMTNSPMENDDSKGGKGLV
jgi:hypothetical protein